LANARARKPSRHASKPGGANANARRTGERSCGTNTGLQQGAAGRRLKRIEWAHGRIVEAPHERTKGHLLMLRLLADIWNRRSAH